MYDLSLKNQIGMIYAMCISSLQSQLQMKWIGIACCEYLKAPPRAPGLCLRLWKAFSKQCRYCDGEKSGCEAKASARQQQRLKPAQTLGSAATCLWTIYLNYLEFLCRTCLLALFALGQHGQLSSHPGHLTMWSVCL